MIRMKIKMKKILMKKKKEENQMISQKATMEEDPLGGEISSIKTFSYRNFNNCDRVDPDLNNPSLV